VISIKLTQRQREIIELLIKEDRFFTVSEIAKKLKISNRTVSREIRDLDSYLAYFSCSIESRTGKGIRFDGREEDIKLLIDNIKKSGEIKINTQNQRIVYILTELLNSNEPLKISNFTTDLNVTEGTISHDLDRVSERLEKYGCKLVRKPGVGLYVDATESDKRRAIVDLIYENIDETELIDIIRNIDRLNVETRENLVNLISKNTLYELEGLLIKNENKLKTTLNDRAYIGLLIHLAIAIDRINKGENIIIDKDYLNILKRCDEYTQANRLAKAIEEKFDIVMPEDEIGYITMHIIGNQGSKSGHISDDIIKISSEILSNAYDELGLYIKADRQSIMWLATHLQPALYRLKMKMEIRNPLLEEIKTNYTQIYNVAVKSVVPIEKELGISIPDSEIAYIAMHIGASVERNKKNLVKYNVIVVCATGMGTATLLSTRLQNEYQNLNIVDVVSSFNLEKAIEANSVDFIISTISLDYEKMPVVLVNPLLLSNDKKLIDDFLKNFHKADKLKEEKTSKPIEKIDLMGLKEYLDSILEVLKKSCC
jgi:Transcriptional antiterminator